jgi:hypothetical protein
MVSNTFAIFLRFLVLVLLQVLVLNNIQLGGFINPYLYVLFILMLPFETPKSVLLIASFVLGLFIDMFSNTMGMHAAACVFMGFCRPFATIYISPRGGYEFGVLPTVKDLGFRWYITYAGIMVFLHHLILFFIEVFRFSDFFLTLNRVFLSTVFTLLLVVISQYLIYGKGK